MLKSVSVDSTFPVKRPQDLNIDTKGKMEEDSARSQKKEVLTDAQIEKKTIDETSDKKAIAKSKKAFYKKKRNRPKTSVQIGFGDDGQKKKKLTKEQIKQKLTKEQIKQIEKETIDNIQVKVDEMKSSEGFDKADEHGRFPYYSETFAGLLNWSYVALQNAPLRKSILLRRKISKMIIQLKAVDVICEIYMYYGNHGWTCEDQGVRSVDPLKSMRFIDSIVALLNYTDASDELAVYIANFPGFLESIRHVLVKSKQEHLSNTEETESANIISYSQDLAYNISMRDVNGTRLRDLDFISAVQPFLKSPKETIQLTALAVLACIVNEKESEIILTNQGMVKIVLQFLEKGLESKSRQDDGWTCKDCAHIIRMLARNDANKKMLAGLGAVELLVKAGQTEDEEVTYESVHALWTLAFDPEIRKQMVANKDIGLVDLLEDILLLCKLPAITEACNGALWVMREELKASPYKKYQQLGDEIKETAKRAEGDKYGHIMISYQWNNQNTLIKIGGQLRANGFKVWMDIDQMAGSTLQSMAHAVENSTIFIMSISRKYKDSQNCRAEAEYAFTKKVNIIPLLIDQGYKPDGWLGIILGDKLFFDFSGKFPFWDKMRDLIKEINTFQKQYYGDFLIQETITPASVTHVTGSPIDTVDSPHIHHPVRRHNPVSKTTLSKVSQWQPADVEFWICKNDLKSCGVSQLTGGELALLLTMRLEAPEYFYRRLETMIYDNNLLTMSKIVLALTNLAEQQEKSVLSTCLQKDVC